MRNQNVDSRPARIGTRLGSASLLAVMILALTLSPTRGAESANKRPAESVPEITWSTTINHFQIDNNKFLGQRLTVRCPPMPKELELQTIFGTDTYPSETPICMAALHSGAVDREGGVVTIQLNPGSEWYKGAERNGIASGDLPKTERSILILTEENTAEADQLRMEHLPRIDWDTRFSQTGLANRKLVGQTFAFRLSAKPNDRRARLVYGTDVYAFATPIGWAALHAGRVDSNGGVVEVKLNAGVTQLTGSTRNGVTTRSKRGDSRTIVFVPKQRDASELQR